MKIRLIDGARIVLGTTAFAVLVGNGLSVKMPAEADPWLNAPQSLVIVAPPRLPDATEMIRRDPFSGGPQAKSAVSSTLPQSYKEQTHTAAMMMPPEPNFGVPNAGQPEIPGFPGGGGVNVPNPGNLLPPNQQSSDRVRIIGTVIGDGHPPVAMISDGQHVDFAHIGDTISGKKITEIRVQGIVFADGTRVAVSDAETPSAVPSAMPDGKSSHDEIRAEDKRVKQNQVEQATETTQPTEITPSAVNPPGGGPVQTTPYTQIQNGAPPTITPGNYEGAPPTLSPGTTAAPLPRYVSPNQQVSP